MPGGYGFFTFGWIQAEREAARVNRFNERWHRLTKIHDLLTRGFVEPLVEASNRLTEAECQKLADYVHEAADWLSVINANVNTARQNHLSRYASAIKKTALKAFGLCKKYGIYSDIESYGYVSGQKMVVLNGRNFYYLG